MYSKFDAIEYIFSRSKHLDKLALIIFAFLKTILIIKRINNFFKS